MSARGGQALDRRYWALLLGTALGVRLLFSVLAMAGLPLVSDDSAYSLQAEGFTRDFPGDEPYYWPPGTSYVLALADELLGASSAVARLTMVAVSLLTLVATVLLARQVLDDPRAVRLTGWILALMPSAVFLPSQPFSFDLTMLGITVAVLGTLLAHDRGRLGWLALAGLGLGVAAAARPGSASLLAALVPIGAVVLARRWRAGERALVGRMALGAVLGTLIAVAAVVPTMLHNCDVGAGAVVSTNNEGNLLFGNNPWTPHYKTWHQGQHAFEDLSPPETAYFKRVFSSDGDPEKRELMREEALDYMGDNPGVTLLRTVNRARAFWGFDYTYANNLSAELDVAKPLVAGAALLEVGGWFLFGGLVLAGVVLGRARFRSGRLLILIAAVAAYLLPHLIAFSAGRWHLPVLGLLAPIAAAGLVELGSPRDALRRVLASRGLVVAIALFALLQIEYAYFVVTGAG